MHNTQYRRNVSVTNPQDPLHHSIGISVEADTTLDPSCIGYLSSSKSLKTDPVINQVMDSQ